MDKRLIKIDQKISPTLIIGGEYYHSRYAPEKEAERYVDRLELNAYSICILIAPGLDYLKTSLERRYQGIKCLTIQPKDFSVLTENEPRFSLRNGHDSCSWFEGAVPSLNEFLRYHIPENQIHLIEMIIWPPAKKIFPTFCQYAGDELASFIKMASANLNTTAYFGVRWYKNLIGNLSHIHKLAELPQSTGSLVLAGSGPGLEDCLDLLKTNRQNYTLWALPSSLRALADREIKPDVVVSSDAGFWAAAHLEYLFSWIGQSPALPIVLAPARAMLRPLWAEWPGGIGLCSMDLPLESVIFRALGALVTSGSPSICVAELIDRGTVAVTALDLLERCHRGIVYTIGIDFSWKDIQSHARPHTFEEQITSAECRLKTGESLRYIDRERRPSKSVPGNGWYLVEPLEIYRHWLATTWQSSAFSILDYNPSLVEKSLPSITLKSLANTLSGKNANTKFSPGRIWTAPASEQRQIGIGGVLQQEMEKLDTSQVILPGSLELGNFLCPATIKEYLGGRLGHKDLVKVLGNKLAHLKANGALNV